jgi:hypothetical protein
VLSAVQMQTIQSVAVISLMYQQNAHAQYNTCIIINAVLHVSAPAAPSFSFEDSVCHFLAYIGSDSWSFPVEGGVSTFGHRDMSGTVTSARYCLLLWHRAGGSGDRIPVGGEIFRTRPDWPWGPPILVYNG